MSLIEMKNIEKSWGDKKLFEISELIIRENDRIGLIGVNGSGKTTLLEMICGNIEASSGNIKRNCQISYFKQFDKFVNTSNSRLLKEMKVDTLVSQPTVSGGENVRLRLANAISDECHLLILDEPTANLDLPGIILLKKKLSYFKTFIIVSHDFKLLDEYCNRIIEIENKTLYEYTGNYSAYQEQKKCLRLFKQREYEKYQDERKRLEKVYEKKKEKAKKIKKRPKNISSSEYKARNFAATTRSNDGRQKSAEKQARAVQTRLMHLEKKEKPYDEPHIKIDFSLTKPPRNKILIQAYNFNFSYEKHIIFRDTSFSIYNGERVALLGPNGCGKTTLFQCIENKESGIRIVPTAKIGFLYQCFDNFDFNLSIYDMVLKYSIQNETIIRIVLARLLFKTEDLNKKIASLSGGERMKLSFAILLLSNINVLVLDEPTNYLDTQSIEVLINLLCNYPGTVFFVSHDIAFTEKVATRLLCIENGQINEFRGTIQDYITKQIM